MRPTTFSSIPFHTPSTVPCHARGANWVGVALLQHSAPCFPLLWWAAGLLPAAQLYGKSWRENEPWQLAEKKVGGAVNKMAWPSGATCNLWAHNVDLATMFFFPLSLSTIGCCAPDWQTWNDLSTASEGVKMHLSQASAHRRLVALRIMTEQRFSDATWGFWNNLCKGVGQDHSKSMTQGIAKVICFPSYLSNVHGMVAIFWYLPGIIWNWMWGPSIPIDHIYIYIVITDFITRCTMNIIIPSISLINQQDSTMNYIDIYTYI